MGEILGCIQHGRRHPKACRELLTPHGTALTGRVAHPAALPQAHIRACPWGVPGGDGSGRPGSEGWSAAAVGAGGEGAQEEEGCPSCAGRFPAEPSADAAVSWLPPAMLRLLLPLAALAALLRAAVSARLASPSAEDTRGHGGGSEGSGRPAWPRAGWQGPPPAARGRRFPSVPF